MSDPIPEQAEQPTTSKWRDIAASIGGWLLYLTFGFGGIALLLLFFQGVGWIRDNVYPWSTLAAGIAALAVVPISILLAIFRKSRGIGAIGLLISSYVIGLGLWIWSLIVVYEFAGVFWLIVGVVIGGIGVVPVAFIAALFFREWSIAGQILIAAIFVYGVRWISLFLSERSGIEEQDVDYRFTDDLALKEAEGVTNAYGAFLAKGPPIIADAKLLPHPKAEIERALIQYEQFLCDVANMHVELDRPEKLQEVERSLNSIRSCRGFLSAYTDIEAEDEDKVTYFNSYRTLKDIPEEEQKQCFELLSKYMSKGMGWSENN